MIRNQMLSVSLGVMCFAASAHAANTAVEYHTPASSVQQVEVNNYNGKISIVPTQDAQAHVRGARNHDGCDVRVVLQDTMLRVDAGRAFDACDVALTIEVPVNVDLDITHGTGDIMVSGVEGRVGITLSTGNIVLDSAVTELDALVGKGHITATDLRGDTFVKLASGDFDLTYTTMGDKAGAATVQIKQAHNTGRSVLTLPEGPISTDVHVFHGSYHNELSTSDTAPFFVKAKIGWGDFIIRQTGSIDKKG